ncbi:hypothetical protein BH09BAC1_BH09BAC1_25060 [soil metagenome]
MKRALFSLLLALSTISLSAQCLGLRTGSEFLYPHPDSIDCAVSGVYFEQRIGIYYDTAALPVPVTIILDSMVITGIAGLPTGLSYTLSKNKITNSPDSICITIAGITNEPAGVYPIAILAASSFSGIPIVITDTLRYDSAASYQITLIDVGMPCNPAPQYPNYISGEVFYDSNGNGVKDGADHGMQNQKVAIAPGNITYYTAANGTYYHETGLGLYTVSNVAPPLFNVLPAPLLNVSFPAFNDSAIGQSFGLHPTRVLDSIEIHLSVSPIRPGFTQNITAIIENVGTTFLSGEVKVIYDSLLAFSVASPPNVIINPDTAEFSFSNLSPGESRNYTLKPKLYFVDVTTCRHKLHWRYLTLLQSG